MGCDIHAFVDFNKPGADFCQSLSEELNLDRDYAMFAKLANVRNHGEDIVPISEPRGLPSRVSHTVSSADNLYIVEKDSNESGTCTQEQAARWIASGSSKLVREKVVTNPDHHSYSWVSLSEFERAISELTSIIKYKLSVEYYAVLSAMKIIAEQGYEVRLVFWFDN
jgi:hypothetical protein